MAKKIKHVFLGRFAPIHKGHQILIDLMIKKYGRNNCIIIIGSSNSFNPRTPYKSTARKKMIRLLYPDLKILTVNDTNPKKWSSEDWDMKSWIAKIMKLEKRINSKFIFCGGSKADIDYLTPWYQAVVVANRQTVGKKISATIVRKMIQNNDEGLEKYLDKKIVNIAVDSLKKFPKQTV